MSVGQMNFDQKACNLFEGHCDFGSVVLKLFYSGKKI
jgi:hypothetical protein